MENQACKITFDGRIKKKDLAGMRDYLKRLHDSREFRPQPNNASKVIASLVAENFGQETDIGEGISEKMHIHEAASEASVKGKKIRRTSWPTGLTVEPTNRSAVNCIISMPDKRPGNLWAPSLDDLIASDWMITV